MKRNIDISIVIPAYNEDRRLPAFLNRVISYCNNNKEVYEIIVVDDGSCRALSEIIQPYKRKFSDLTVLRINKNRGKGYAVKRGLLESKGNVCLFFDADGSVDPDEIGFNLHYITDDGFDIFVGSRVLKDKSQNLKIKWHRKVLGTFFNFFVQSFLFKDIKDTQCGFKMFKKEVVKPLFSRSYIRGFGFDVEILYLAHKMGYKIKEGPVSWHHVNGSKVSILADPLDMFINILQTRNWHCTPINPFHEYLGPGEYKYMYELENYHWWFVSRRRLAMHIMKSFPMESPKILDVGCGTGGNLLSFGQIGPAFGLDISEKAVEFCMKRGLKNVMLSSAEKIKHADRAFDIIVCLDLLEHVINPVETLLEIKRVLKNRGKIVITVPAFRILWSQHDEALCHLRRYEKESLLSDLQEAGLKVEKMGYFFFTSFFVVAPVRIMRRFFVSADKKQSDTTTLPPRVLNELLKVLFNIEMKIADRINLPLGTTIYAVVSKIDQNVK